MGSENSSNQASDLAATFEEELKEMRLQSKELTEETLRDISNLAVRWGRQTFASPSVDKEGVRSSPVEGPSSCFFELHCAEEYLGQLFGLSKGFGFKREGRPGKHLPLRITGFEQGPLALIAARFLLQEPCTESITAVTFPCHKHNYRLAALHSSMLTGKQVGLAAIARDTENIAIVIPCQTKEKRGSFMLGIAPTEAWKTWVACLKQRKLCLGADLDKTLIDAYTVPQLEALLASGTLDECERPLAIVHSMALRHYHQSGEVPGCITQLYGEARITQAEGAVKVRCENGGQVVFTRYPSGTPLLICVRPGWETLRAKLCDHYFTFFITQASRVHALVAMAALDVGSLRGADVTDDASLAVICRDGATSARESKSFAKVGVGATTCFLALDDLQNGSDESPSKIDGVSTWEREDLKLLLKPVPYHAYSTSKAGQSDQVPLEICANLLVCVHHRFFALVDQIVERARDHPGLLDSSSLALPRLQDIMGFYGRNNTTSAQATAAFVHSTMRKLYQE